jgi:hypothetical protein
MNPNDMPGSSRFVKTNMVVPVEAVVGLNPVWTGSSMTPHMVTEILPQLAYSGRGTGVFDLDQPDVPPKDVRFTRGPRASGQQGTIELLFVTGAVGVARSLCYLVDNPVNPTNYLGVGIDTSNRPFVSWTDELGVVNALVIPSTAAIGENRIVKVRATWNSVQVIDGTRHGTFTVNGEAIPTGDWSTDPIAPWGYFPSTHLLLGMGIGGASDFNGEIKLCQVSNFVNP